MDSQRVSASAPISPCRPARRTRWSPTLPPGIREKMIVGLQVMIIFLTVIFSITLLIICQNILKPKVMINTPKPEDIPFTMTEDKQKKQIPTI